LDSDDDGEDSLQLEMLDPKEDRKDDLPVVSFCDDLIDEARARGSLSPTENEFDHKYEPLKIEDCHRKLLANIGGPDESIATKIEQLEMHQALDDLYYEAGELTRNSFSHYLMASRKQRQVFLAQLRHAQSVGHTKENLKWMARRLEKLPVGKSSLADRGFADCATSYPSSRIL
jgi:hypothetical protein